MSEPVEVTETYEVFSSALPDAGMPLSLGELVDNNAKYLGKTVVSAPEKFEYSIVATAVRIPKG